MATGHGACLPAVPANAGSRSKTSRGRPIDDQGQGSQVAETSTTSPLLSFPSEFLSSTISPSEAQVEQLFWQFERMRMANKREMIMNASAPMVQQAAVDASIERTVLDVDLRRSRRRPNLTRRAASSGCGASTPSPGDRHSTATVERVAPLLLSDGRIAGAHFVALRRVADLPEAFACRSV